MMMKMNVVPWCGIRRHMSSYVALTFLFVLFLIPLTGAHAAGTGTTYYLSPAGSDAAMGTTPSAPWKTFAFATLRLQPGDTLVLQDGTYNGANSGYPVIDCATGHRNGTVAQPITIRADHERQAVVVGNGAVDVVTMGNCAYWTFDGLRTQSADYAGGGENVGVHYDVRDSSNIIFRRLLLAQNNRYWNTHLLQLYRTSTMLVEESEFYAFHRHALSTPRTSNSIFRRNYFNSRGYADIPGGYASADPTRGEAAINIYPGSNNIAENNISEGNGFGMNIEATDTSTGNQFLGNISLNDTYGVFLSARGNTAAEMPQNNTLENMVVVNVRDTAAYLRSNKNTQCINCSFLGGYNGFVADVASGALGDGVYSVVCTNCLSINHPSTYGFNIVSQTTFGVNYANAFNTAAPFSPSSDPQFTNTSTSDPQLGTCKVFIPASSPMKDAGKNGADIGANVLYRYQDGVLTTQPLWDPATGEFPHGALVAGVNDVPDQSVFDVHNRLNVNTNGCSFPAGYSVATPPSITTQPTNQTVTAGQTATFSVIAAGTAPLSYQWQKNSTNISGAISASYTTPITTTADSGSTFRVIVTNTAGSITSNNATLTVNPSGSTPIAYYKLDETSGTTAADSAGTNPGTLVNGPVWTTGRVDGALSFNGINQYVTVPDSVSLDLSSTATIVSWVKTSSYFNSAFINKELSYELGIDIDGTLKAALWASASWVWVDSDIVVPLNQWTYVAATYDGTNISFYLNGTLVATKPNTSSGTLQNTSHPLRLAARDLAQDGVVDTFVPVSLDDVRIYNRTLTAAEVQSLYAGTVTAPTITTQPTNQTVIAGQTATFSVIAAGTAPLFYQWQENSANISGATSASYTTPLTTTADSGSTFKVMVTNTAGSVTSNSATLTVIVPNSSPTANAGPDQSVMVNTVVTLSGSGTDPDGDPLTYAWDFGDSTTGSGASVTHTYIYPDVYTATLTVSDGKGGSAADSAIITVTGSTKFKINDAITVFTGGGKLNVRSTPGGAILGTQANGNKGTIMGGPQFANSVWWWNVNFTSGADGWAAEDYMVLTAGSLTPRLDQITFTAVAPSGQQVSGVQWYLDSVAFGAEDTTSPYSIAVTFSTLSAGSHTMYGKFRNSSAQTANTQTFTFNASGSLAEATMPGSTVVMQPLDSSMSTSSQLASIAAALETLKAALARLLGK